MNEIVPAMLLLYDGVILNKDGSLSAAFVLSGVDLEGKEQSAYDYTANNQEHSFTAFDDRITLDQYVDRIRVHDYPEGEFADPVSKAIDDTWRTQFENGDQYENRLTLWLTFTPKTNADGLIDRIMTKATIEGKGWLTAITSSVSSHWSLSKQLAYSSEEVLQHLREFEQQISAYLGAFSSGSLKRCLGGELLGAAYRRINLRFDVTSVAITDAPIYLDSVLSASTVSLNAEDARYLNVDGMNRKFVSAICIKEWPSSCWAGMLDHLLTIPGEFSVHHSFRFASQQAAAKHIDTMESHHRDMAVKFKDMVGKAITGREPSRLDQGRLSLAADAAAAKASITANNERFGWYHFSILVAGDTKEELEATLDNIVKSLSKFELVWIRESMGLMSAYAGNIPGNADLLIRWFFFSAAAFANLINLRTVTSGSIVNRYYSSQARKPMPALTSFSTQYNTPYHFSPHIDDLGNTFLVGPPGAGKTVLANFLISQFRRYPGGNVYVFDKDQSCAIVTQLCDGQYIDLGSAMGRGVMNPYALLAERDSDGKITHFEWLISFTKYLLESLSPEMPLSAEKGDYEEIEQALKLVAEMATGGVVPHLFNVQAHLGSDLARRLAPWVGESERGRYFDNSDDAFSLSQWTTIEMGSLLERDPICAMAVLDYAVYRIAQRLQDASVEPTIIYIEEVWFMLRNPAFERIIENWLRVLRKKNAILVFATQSLDELARSEISSAIMNTIPTRIFLPNEDVRSDLNYKLYHETFGLNDSQISQIQQGLRKTNYLIVQGSFSRMVWAKFDPTILACLRSDKQAKALFAKWHATRDQNPDWKINYIEEAAHA
jgi:type IV secretion system protein TrbE